MVGIHSQTLQDNIFILNHYELSLHLAMI